MFSTRFRRVLMVYVHRSVIFTDLSEVSDFFSSASSGPCSRQKPPFPKPENLRTLEPAVFGDSHIPISLG